MEDEEEFYDNHPPNHPNLAQQNPNIQELEAGGILHFHIGMLVRDVNESPPESDDADSGSSNASSPPHNILEEWNRQPVVRNAAQSEMLVNILDLLKRRKNALVESPPGIQRKLTIIMAALQYLQEERKKCATTPRIYFATRNYQESKMLSEEFRENIMDHLPLLDGIKYAVLDHRMNFCLNEQVTGAHGGDRDAIDLACRKRVMQPNHSVPSTSKRAKVEVEEGPPCEFYWNSQGNPENSMPFFVNDQIHDIEDFLLNGRETTRCPWHDALHLSLTANLIFLPVDILLSPYHREEYFIQLDNSIVIIDDGYNLENLCKKELSITITKECLTRASRILREIAEHYQTGGNVEEIGFTELLNFLPQFANWLPSRDPDRFDRADILAQINQLNAEALNVPRLVSAILEYANNCAHQIPDEDAGIIKSLAKLVHILKLMVDNDSFGAILKSEEVAPDSNRIHTVLRLICTDPSLILAPIESDLSSLILGANSIAPYNPLLTEFGVIFDEIIKIHWNEPMVQNRLLVAYTQKGPNGIRLELDFSTRSEEEVMREVGCSVLKICLTVPGVVVFMFHSWDYLQKLIEFWQNDIRGERNILAEIRNIKRVFCELDMTSDEEIQHQMDQFVHFADVEGKAILFAYHRGKLYKNWDLKYPSVDVRAFVHVSIPFGPWKTDDFIVEKRKAFERRHMERNTVENKNWYKREAFRILNQSFGYTMKNGETDWGFVIVLDTRMPGEIPGLLSETLPDWISPPPPTRFRNLNELLETVAENVDQFAF